MARGRIVNISPYATPRFTDTVRIVKRNPWLSGNLARLVDLGLANPKTIFVYARPPPWFRDPSKLTPKQKAVVDVFININKQFRGRPLGARIAALKEAFGYRVPDSVKSAVGLTEAVAARTVQIRQSRQLLPG